MSAVLTTRLCDENGGIGYLLCRILLAFLLPITAWSDQLIVEPDMGRAPLVEAINNTQHTIDLVIYGFTDDQLMNALIKQKQNGRTINVILEKEPYKATSENDNAFAAFNRAHINWQGSIPPYRLIHQKTLLIDDHKAYVMTFNFTRSSFKNERNFGLVIDDARRVNEIAAVFAADWNHHAMTKHADDLIWSPDDSRQKLTKLITSAKQSLQIYAQDVNDYHIVGALAKAARKGVSVQILTSKKMRDKQATYLANAGVKVCLLKKLYIHAKIMIIDHNKAVIGSINFTRASLDENRELAVVTRDNMVIKQLTQTFQSDWKQADSLVGQLSLPDKRKLLHAFKMLKRQITAVSWWITAKNA